MLSEKLASLHYIYTVLYKKFDISDPNTKIAIVRMANVGIMLTLLLAER